MHQQAKESKRTFSYSIQSNKYQSFFVHIQQCQRIFNNWLISKISIKKAFSRRQKVPTSSFLLLLLTSNILNLGAKVDTTVSKKSMKNGSSSPKRFIITSGSFECRISGNGPDIYVLKKRSHSTRSFVPNTQVAYVQVPRGLFTSKRWFSQCNILHVNDCYKPDPLPTSIHTPSLSRTWSPKKCPGFFPSTGLCSSKNKPPTR